MDPLQKFMPIQKVDAQKRIVYGVLAAEVEDHSGEILDYDSSVPYFKAWNAEFEKLTDGKSKGNVRAMHGQNACGKLVEIVFDDVNKTILGGAKIVDEAEWAKVEEGVYTGFSIGGKYVKRWPCPNKPTLKRYTPEMVEVSLVDKPCIPVATFQYIKSDGAVEMRKFLIAKEAEEVGVAIKQGWQAKDGTFFGKKTEAVTHNVTLAVQEALKPITDALQKADDALTAKEGVATDVDQPAVEKADEPAPAAVEAVAKADEPEPSKDGNEAKPEDDAEKAAAIATTIKATIGSLQKGLYDVARVAELVMEMRWLVEDLAFNEVLSGGKSGLPGDLKTILGSLCDFLQALVAEATSEITADKAVASALTAAHVETLRKITGKAELLKDFTVPVNDDLIKAQADLAETLEKLETESAEKEAMAKAVTKFEETITKMVARIELLEAQPMPAKGLVGTVTVFKGHEGAASGAEKLPVEAIALKYSHLPPGEGRAEVQKELAAQAAT